jgi:hypothetical protein
MLEAKKIDVKDLRQYIDIAFANDCDLLNYYDKSAGVLSGEAMVVNTYNKIKDYLAYFHHCFAFKICIDGDDAGFIFFTKSPNLLVSFSINKKYRQAEILKDYFESIKDSIADDFMCLLYKENTRAINWLVKCGMEVEFVNEEYTKINYILCH